MKILISARRFRHPFSGGVDVYADRLARAFLSLGHHPIILALEPSSNGALSGITIEREQWNGLEVVRIRFDIATRTKEAFDTLYDREICDLLKRIFEIEPPHLFIILNFYLLTLAAVDAARQLGLPVFHIATDFLSVCKRGTLIRWDDQPCATGQSLKSCTRCFLSNRFLGRIGCYWLNKLPESAILAGARRVESACSLVSLPMAEPFSSQFRVIHRRLEIVSRLTPGIERVFAPTRFTAKMYRQAGFTEEQLCVLPFGVEPFNSLSTVKKAPSRRKRFLFIGRLQPYKGLHVLLEAFRGVREPERAILTVYGAADGHREYVDSLRLAIDRHPQILFKGALAPARLAAAFSEADFFVLPSLWHENSPLVVLDALHSKTPVIASDVGGVADLISNGRNGILFPMGDSKRLREILQRLIDDPEPLAGFQMDSQLPSIGDYAREVLGCFQQCRPAAGSF